MHILIAPDSYKGSLTARQVCDILAQALLTHPGVTVATLPLSDGGEGFGTCCVDACKGDILYTNAVDLYGNAIQAPLYTWGDTALIECAATCALQTKKDIMAASSYGVGMQLKNAIDLGFHHFIIGLGGSGMCDGGAGALAALGVAFYDRNGTAIPHPTGGDLQRIERLQIPSDFQHCVKCMHFTYACDVTNPYTGENGAAAVFGPQKGATPAQVQLLNNGMAHLAALLPNAVRALPGAGAAGGLYINSFLMSRRKTEFGLYGVLGGSTQSGFDLLAALADLDSAIAGADLVITGEGRTDRQTLMGKLPYRVAQRAKKLGKRCVVISGDGDGTLVGDKVITLTDKDTPPRAAIAHAAALLAEKADLLLQ